MTRLLTILLAIQVFSSCGQNAERVETILFNCLTESYKSEGVDLENQLNMFELYLIKNGSLESTSGQAYFDFYNKIVEVNDIPVITDFNKFQGLYKLRPDQYYSPECLTRLSLIDSNEIKASKYYDLTLAMQNLKSNTNISPSIVAKEIISVLDASDFDKSYYRSIALLTIANTANIELGLTTKLPPIEKQEGNYEDFANITVAISASEEICADKTVIEKEELKSQLRNFILKNESEHVIYFQTDRGTSYDFYLRTQDLIKEIYNELREMKSQEQYGKSFDSLSDIEKKEIKKYTLST